jgi:hypothetical protein
VIRAFRLAAAAVLAAALVVPTPVLGWAHAGDGYGTHDWILDQALRVLDGRVDDWFDYETARLATDDPDTVESNPPGLNDHVYKGEGKRGGGVDRIAREFDLAQASYDAGDYSDASYHIGLMAHFVGDLGQPFHTDYDAMDETSLHRAYELMVNDYTRRPNDRPDWQPSSRTPSTVTNVRTTAIGTAAFSRKYYDPLYAALRADGVRLSSRISDITGAVMKRTASDLADLIWSIDKGVGAQPQVGSLKMTVKWTGVLGGSTNTVFVTARDVNGKPIEGLLVTVAWPTANGSRTEYLFTDQNGAQKRIAPVGSTPKLVSMPVTATTRVRGVTTKATGAWTISPRLADGRAGFLTRVNDQRVTAGQTVRVVSIARDRSGRAVPNLLVTWTWDYAGTKVRTSALTDANGRASSSRVITTTTTTRTVTVTAITQSGSVNRSASASFRRTD